MARLDPDKLLDHLAELARDQEPPPLSGESMERMVQRAVGEGATERVASPRRVIGLAIAAAAAVALVVTGVAWTVLRQDPSEGGEGAPFRALLTSGDRVTATPGSELRVDSMLQEDRRVSLDSGTALFDVEPLSVGQRFRVVTDHLEVEVRGTVFSVETGAGRTVVRVYEGRVDVVQGGDRRSVPARQMWASDAAGTRSLDGGPLAAEGREAARRREALAESETESDPELPPTDPEAPSPPSPEGEAPPSPEPSEPTEEPVAGAREELLRDGEPSSGWGVTVAEAPEAEAPVAAPSLGDVRGWIADGRAAEALAASRAALDRGEPAGPWSMVEADALRALGRSNDAATAYLRAAHGLPPSRAAQAGYLASFIRLRRLGDAPGALAALDATGADRASSPLAERATALRARALDRMGRGAEARAVALRYLARYPGGGMAEWMRRLVGDDAETEAATEAVEVPSVAPEPPERVEPGEPLPPAS